MEVQNAIFSIRAKFDNFVFCAFDHQILFGTPSYGKFEPFKCFEVNHYEMCDLFCGLFYIVKSISTNVNTKKGVLCKKSNVLSYFWEIVNESNKKMICFSIEQNSNICYKYDFKISHFNDTVFSIGNLAISCLKLSEKSQTITQHVLNLDLDQILKFRKEDCLKMFLRSQKQNFHLSSIEEHEIYLQIFYHLDVIVAIHNIKSLYNNDLNLTHKNIDTMLSCQ